MNTNIAEFTDELRLEIRRTVDDVVKAKKLIALEALRRIIQKTPVDTGRARGNWQVSLELLAEENWSKDPLSEGAAYLSKLRDFEILYIFNNVEYVIYLEEGHSSQAPQGMVAITLQELEELFGE